MLWAKCWQLSWGGAADSSTWVSRGGGEQCALDKFQKVKVPLPPQVSTGAHSLQTGTPKYQLKEEAGPCPVKRPHVSHSQSQGDLPDLKAPWRSKRGWMPKLPIGLFAGIHLGWAVHVCTWEDPELSPTQTLNQPNQHDWPRESQKKCPTEVIQTAMRMQLSLWEHLHV